MSTDADTIHTGEDPLPTEPYTVIEVTWLNDREQPPLIEQYVLQDGDADESWLCLNDGITWSLLEEPIEWRIISRPITTQNQEPGHAATH